MERNPLYFNTSEGGLSPVATPDSLSPAILPALRTQRDRVDNRNFFLLDSAVHIVIPTTHISVLDLMDGVTDSTDLVYRVVSYNEPNSSYYFSSPAEPTSFITGLCLGIVSIGVEATDYVVIQTSGLVTPVVCSGYTQPYEYPEYQSIFYLGEAGAIEETGTIQVTNQKVISVQAMAQLTKQAVTSGGIMSSAGLIVSAKAGTVVTIGDGLTTHTKKYEAQTAIATLPINSTKHLYQLTNNTVEVSDKEYIVVPTETNLDLVKSLCEVTTATKASNVVVSGNTIKSTALSSWGSCYCANPKAYRWQYFQFTYASGGVSNTMIGVGAVNSSTVPANTALNNTASGIPQSVYLSLVSTSASFAKTANATQWTINYTTALTLGTATKVYGILVDQKMRTVYWSVDGVWLNSGNPVLTHSGSFDKIVPIFSVANDTVKITFDTPTTVTLPAAVTYYNYYDKSTNTSYTYNFAGTTTISYAPKMYLGTVTTNGTQVVSINEPAINNSYTDEIYVDELTTINHNLFALAPQVSINQEQGITYTTSSTTSTQMTLSTNTPPLNNTIITVTT